jgi:hypothetical protein
VPFIVVLALLVGRALSCADFVESAPFCFHLDVGITPSSWPEEYAAISEG